MACAVKIDGENVLQQHSDTSSISEMQAVAPENWDLYDANAVGESDELPGDRTAFTSAVKLLKLVVYGVTFCVLLGGCVVSKATLLFMTSVVGKGRGLTPCNVTGLESDSRFVIKLSDEERYTWTWCLFFVLVVPEILTFFRSVRLCVFKQYSKPKISSFLVVMTAESFHVIGLTLMLLVAFPRLPALSGLTLTNATCLIPSLLYVISQWRSSRLKTSLNLAALAGQLSVFAVVVNSGLTWGLASAVLASFAWWENFSGGLSCLAGLRKDIEKSRNFVYVFVSLWKIVLVFVVCLGCVFVDGDDVGKFIGSLTSSFDGTRHNLTVTWPFVLDDQIPDGLRPPENRILQVFRSNPFLPVIITSIHIASSYICYACGKLTCKICIQGFSYALPIVLTVPATMGLLVTVCSMRGALVKVLPYHFWACSAGDSLAFFGDEVGYLWVVWLLSQMWVTSHLWFPECERMASTHKLFVNPMYCSVLIDQSLALNRRKDEKIQAEKKPSMGSKEDNFPMIYACATMWHETPDEMEQLLKSIMRMDFHQCQQSIIGAGLQVSNPDYYEMEAHIFFDDAFVISDESDDKMTINSFVKDLVVAVNTAARKVYQKFGDLPQPLKVGTPYGGRLIWILPGQNILMVHMKNKDLIRHKKRWSQVMYMYYLLGFNLQRRVSEDGDASLLARNTFILALDGDIDFQPDAVQLLVDLMNRNKGLGAACGRIHPVGTGLMVYYQKFEYAIGHWLQKATEHMIGCVLCSPGCFSLFRAEALVRNNTVRRYATTSREAIEYVQFDQGEDRWLCTLLLQRGYRVEYSAASDAYTHCPESFAEFYTQRRRWAPSTLANIADLLVHYKDTVQCNDNISRPYVAYQVLLMMGTILGPGTIFLMIVGAMVSAFGVSNWHSFAANIVPIVFFILICFHAKNDTQIFVAQVLSALYALLMMAVLVGISLQLVTEGVTSPSALFVLAMAASFLAAALLHPREFWCVAHGLLYFLAVPSMYLLLALYSFVNLHVVSWGTREVAVKKTRRQMKQELLLAAAVQKPTPSSKGGGMFDWVHSLGDKGLEQEEGGLSFNLANLFRCMCCTYPKPDPASLHMARVEGHLKEITDHMHNLQRQMDNNSTNRVSGFRRRSIPHVLQKDFVLNAVAEDVDEDDEINDPTNEKEEEDDEEEEIPEMDHHKHWLGEKCLLPFQQMFLPDDEKLFWDALIEKYLAPLKDNPDEKAKVSRQLLDLRNNVVFGILMLNSLFILVVFLLQMQKDTLHVEWPLDPIANITFLPEFDEIRVDMTYLQLEPINLVLVFFFSLILVVQFGGMVLHRFQTLSHILSSTEIFSSKSEDDENKIDFSQLTNRLHKHRLMEGEEEDEEGSRVDGMGMAPASVQPNGSCQGSVMGARPRSLSMALEKDLLKILKKDRKFEQKVRRMSRIPNPVAALQRRTSSYNLSSAGGSTPMSGSLREGLRRLDMAFESEQATPRARHHSYVNQAFRDSSVLDTLSIKSSAATDNIQMQDLGKASATRCNSNPMARLTNDNQLLNLGGSANQSSNDM